MDVRLDGRTALITGGSLGLGRAMGIEFARSGASVAILGRTRETLDEALAMIEAWTKAGEAKSVGLLGNAADIFPELVQKMGNRSFQQRVRALFGFFPKRCDHRFYINVVRKEAIDKK